MEMLADMDRELIGVFQRCFDFLILHQGYEKCKYTKDEGWPLKKVDFTVDGESKDYVCRSTEKVVSFKDQTRHMQKYPRSAAVLAYPCGIAGQIPCPWVLLEKEKWFFPQDKEEHDKGQLEWTVHVLFMRQGMRRHLSLGRNVNLDPDEWESKSHPSPDRRKAADINSY